MSGLERFHCKYVCICKCIYILYLFVFAPVRVVCSATDAAVRQWLSVVAGHEREPQRDWSVPGPSPAPHYPVLQAVPRERERE